MLTNTVFRKFAVGFMSLAIFSMMLMTVGCSENSENQIANSNADEVVVITTPEGEEVEILQSEIDMYKAQSESFQIMIEAMDPFVTENKDGTYQFDSIGFNAVNQNLNADNMDVYGELTKGIPIINKQILEERKSPGSTALAIYCNWYWWGKRCCYTGNEAWKIVSILGGIGTSGYYYFPLFGAISATIGVYLGYYAGVYGGFCLNYAWGGLYWISRP